MWGGERVLIGRDTRATGPMLQHAVQCGLLAAGCEVVDLGVLPTPTIQMYTGASRARGGIALTASHNPPEYNALKLFNGQGLFFNHYERGELIDLYHQSEFYQATNEEMREVRSDHDTARKLHIRRVLRHVDVEVVRARKFKVGLDAVNGAGAVMSPGFLTDDLGCDLVAISIDPTQPFPSARRSRSLRASGEIAKLVKEQGCDIGFRAGS
jgi:phosphomannomutase